MANISGHSVTVSGVTGVTEVTGHSRVPEQQVKGERTHTRKYGVVWNPEEPPVFCSVPDPGVSVCAGILSELLQRENRVLHFWTLKKRRLDQCQQYLMFQSHAQQVDGPAPKSYVSICYQLLF